MAFKFNRDVLKGPTKTQGDFHLAHLFSMEIDQVTIGGIRSVTGLDHEHETVDYLDGDDDSTRFRPGRQKTGTITISRDWSSTTEFYDWFKTLIQGKVARKSISLIFKNDRGDEASRINLYDAFPKKWTVSGLNSKSSGHVSEALEIVYERMEFKTA